LLYVATKSLRIKNEWILADYAHQELKTVMFYRSYHFIQELKANSHVSEKQMKRYWHLTPDWHSFFIY